MEELLGTYDSGLATIAIDMGWKGSAYGKVESVSEIQFSTDLGANDDCGLENGPNDADTRDLLQLVSHIL